MKTMIKLAAGILFLFGGLTLFSSLAPEEVTQIVDQINPLLPTTQHYVKITSSQSVNDYGTASYRQLAADKNGQTRKIQFNGLSELKIDHYLKLTTKGSHVETYEEVTKEEVPHKALKAIDNA